MSNQDIAETRERLGRMLRDMFEQAATARGEKYLPTWEKTIECVKEDFRNAAEQLVAYGIAIARKDAAPEDTPRALQAMFDRLEPEHIQTMDWIVNAARRRVLRKGQEARRMLRRLMEKTKRANEIQHSGGRVSAEDWSELYALTNEAAAVLDDTLMHGDES